MIVDICWWLLVFLLIRFVFGTYNWVRELGVQIVFWHKNLISKRLHLVVRMIIDL